MGRCGERVMAVVEKPTGQKSAGLTLRARWLLVAMTWQHTEQKKNGGKKEKKWRYNKTMIPIKNGVKRKMALS